MKKEKRPVPKIPLVAALALLLLGALLVFFPDTVLGLLPPLVGTVMLLVGLQGLIHALVMGERLPEPGMKMLQSVIYLLVGLIFLVKQDISLAFLSILFGLYVLVTAAIHLSLAIDNRRKKKAWGSELGESIFQFVLGVVLLFAPFVGHSLWVRLLGLHFVVAAAGTLLWVKGQQNAAESGETEEDGAGEEE